MLLLITLLTVAIVLQQSLGEDNSVTVNVLSEEQKKEIVDKHNDIRRGVKPTASNMLKMTWSEKVSENAKKWARKCQGRNSPKEEVTVNGSFLGENIFQGNYASSWSDVIDVWYKTMSNFKYGVGATDPTKSSSPYTQIIWYRSHEVGCASVKCPKRALDYFYVCQYNPTGNIQEKMATPYKEGPPCKDCPDNCEANLCNNPCKYVDYPSCKVLLTMMNDCNNQWMDQECQATCRCTSNIT